MTSLHAILPLVALGAILAFVAAYVGAAIYLRPRRRPRPGRAED
ncbi:hypothetical protein QO010_003768 [Caulobacter ginsengisoli]|uniref:Uncharacterized protein n=1 Tax=Caulobacter ginsengisoli TaxID=400775 RepID=A0ABU0IX71_9CAUL|nr:hypothetical protein [Caulobacter ginsengisoli]MDQ0465975.1 hypothetical protein [Caulobacter ginsengisoli]